MFSSFFLKEWPEPNELIALFTFSNTRASCSLWKSDSLFLRVGFTPFWKENFKLDLKFFITLFSFAFHRSSCSFKKGVESKVLSSFFAKRAMRAIYSHLSSLFTKKRKERFTLLKRVKEWFTFYCQKTSDSHEKPKSEFPTLIFPPSNLLNNLKEWLGISYCIVPDLVHPRANRNQ